MRLCARIYLFTLVFLLGTAPTIQADQKKSAFPDVEDAVGVFAEQLPSDMTEGQVEFAAKHYVGSQKLSLSITRKLRRYNPDFIVLHYHLGIWQQQPRHNFIVDGEHWGNDWQEVNQHEDWFWHNEKGERVRSSGDGKYLMNITNPAFQEYWKTSITEQMKKGHYQGVFLDSSSIDLLQGEVSKSDTRLSKKAAGDRVFAELGGITWREAYERFMTSLTDFIERSGFASIPNIGPRFTVWDKTDYYTTASGAFVENAFMTTNVADWRFAVEKILELTKRNKIVIFQPYLKNDPDIERRMYFLSCYLLIKGRYSYINYFSNNHLSWYPEFNIRLGKPILSLDRLDDLVDAGVYRRQFERGEVYVNSTGSVRTVNLKKACWKVIPQGGGPVSRQGQASGNLEYKEVSEIVLAPWSGEILLYDRP